MGIPSNLSSLSASTSPAKLALIGYVVLASLMVASRGTAFTDEGPRTKRRVASSEDQRETAEWLKGHLSQTVPALPSGFHIIDFGSLNDCTLSIRERWSSGPGEYMHWVALRELDPDHHKIEAIQGYDGPIAWTLKISTRSGNQVVRTCELLQGKCGPQDFYSNDIEFLFEDRAMAERASQALAHAIYLCGGKKSRF